MLSRLSVENYALIEKLDMELGAGLNIVTGETGAGKSILLGALGLILGNRADTTALKDNEKNCVVEGSFDISSYGLEPFFEENDLEYEPQTIVRRVITPAGKSRTYVNDLPVQLTTLKELSLRLIDIHSQHQTRMVSDAGFRARIIDSVAANRELLEKYGSVYGNMRRTERELRQVAEEAERSRRDEDYLRHQYEQLASMNLSTGEMEELEAEQKELANAEQISTSLGSAGELLDRDETGVLASLKEAAHLLHNIAGVYPRGQEFSERMNGAYLELKDVFAEVQREGERVEHNPVRLAQVDDRIGAIYALQQKHRVATVEELIALRDDFGTRLSAITSSGERLAELEAALTKLRGEATALAAKITAARTKAGKALSAEVCKLLDRLGMPAARFVCNIAPAEELTALGADDITFLFASGAGSTPQPLDKIASGGETSRVMLALKTIVARNTKLPTIVFDEIDTGVSGRIADATGDIIAELAATMQVINITHLPQVASKGDTHFLVYKDGAGGAVRTHIRLLTRQERVREIANMLSGSTVTDAALRQAETLLGTGKL